MQTPFPRRKGRPRPPPEGLCESYLGLCLAPVSVTSLPLAPRVSFEVPWYITRPTVCPRFLSQGERFDGSFFCLDLLSAGICDSVFFWKSFSVNPSSSFICNGCRYYLMSKDFSS